MRDDGECMCQCGEVTAKSVAAVIVRKQKRDPNFWDDIRREFAVAWAEAEKIAPESGQA